MPSCSLRDSTHTSRRAWCDEHTAQEHSGTAECRKHLVLHTVMSQTLIFRGKQGPLHTANKERMSTGSLCCLFHQGLLKASGFHKGGEVSRAVLHKHLRIGLFGFCGG